MNTYRSILRRVGIVFIVVGTLDVGLMIYCIMNKLSYSSSFNVFAIIAGVLLVRGHLRTARFVTWVTAFFSTCLLVAIVALFPFVQPLELYATQFRLNPVLTSVSCIVVLILISMLIWSYRQLRLPPVIEARVAAGHSASPPRGAFVLGICLPVALLILIKVIENSAADAKAIELARIQAKVGAEYKLYVSGMHWTNSHVRANVTAFKSDEIKLIEVEWDE